MRFANLTMGIVAASAMLVATPALAAPTIEVDVVADPGNATSFAGTYLIKDLAANTDYELATAIHVPIPTTHAGGPFDVTVTGVNEGSGGFKTLSATINGTAISLSPSGPGSSTFVGDTTVNIPNGINTVDLVFSGKTGSSSHTEIPGTFTFSATTPEPATWFMLIAGLGFVGAMLRRQRGAVFA